MRKIFTVLFLIAINAPAQQPNAPGLPEVENLQDFYRSGIGVRAGWPIAALTFKHFVKKAIALEFIAAPQFGGTSFTILSEVHQKTKRPGVYWYYGLGVDAGLFDGDRFRRYDGDYFLEEEVFSIGVAAVLGIEINIHETPFSIGFDLKPHIGIYNPGGSILEGAVTFKHIWSW